MHLTLAEWKKLTESVKQQLCDHAFKLINSKDVDAIRDGMLEIQGNIRDPDLIKPVITRLLDFLKDGFEDFIIEEDDESSSDNYEENVATEIFDIADTYSNYYDVLGIPRDAQINEIKSAHRKLAKKWHPDRNKAFDAEENFKKIQEAWEVLANLLKDMPKFQTSHLEKHNQDPVWRLPASPGTLIRKDAIRTFGIIGAKKPELFSAAIPLIEKIIPSEEYDWVYDTDNGDMFLYRDGSMIQRQEYDWVVGHAIHTLRVLKVEEKILKKYEKTHERLKRELKARIDARYMNSTFNQPYEY